MWRKCKVLFVFILCSISLVCAEPPEELTDEEADEFLVIHFINGETVRFGFSLDDSPEVMFDPEYEYNYDQLTDKWTESKKGIRVNVCTWNDDCYYSFDDVDKITYELKREPAGIQSVTDETKEEQLVVLNIGNGIRLCGCNDAPVSVVSLDGVIQPVKIVRMETYVDLDTSGLVTGVYIVTAGSKSFKFAKL